VRQGSSLDPRAGRVFNTKMLSAEEAAAMMVSWLWCIEKRSGCWNAELKVSARRAPMDLAVNGDVKMGMMVGAGFFAAAAASSLSDWRQALYTTRKVFYMYMYYVNISVRRGNIFIYIKSGRQPPFYRGKSPLSVQSTDISWKNIFMQIML